MQDTVANMSGDTSNDDLERIFNFGATIIGARQLFEVQRQEAVRSDNPFPHFFHQGIPFVLESDCLQQFLLPQRFGVTRSLPLCQTECGSVQK